MYMAAEEATVGVGVVLGTMTIGGQADKAREYVTTGESKPADGLETADHAALTAVVQALMNFDECVTKR